jgi:hypothetical protein
MENNTTICKNCKKQVPKSNLILHEAQCREVVQVANNNNNEPQENFENEYTYCQACDNYIPNYMFADHQISHQYDQENRRQNMDIDIEDISEENSPREDHHRDGIIN